MIDPPVSNSVGWSFTYIDNLPETRYKRIGSLARRTESADSGSYFSKSTSSTAGAGGTNSAVPTTSGDSVVMVDWPTAKTVLGTGVPAAPPRPLAFSAATVWPQIAGAVAWRPNRSPPLETAGNTAVLADRRPAGLPATDVANPTGPPITAK